MSVVAVAIVGSVAAAAILVAAAVGAGSVAAGQERVPHGRLFPPELLGQLEGPDRNAWQQPDQVMDALAIADGARVADVGAGGGGSPSGSPGGLVQTDGSLPRISSRR